MAAAGGGYEGFMEITELSFAQTYYSERKVSYMKNHSIAKRKGERRDPGPWLSPG